MTKATAHDGGEAHRTRRSAPEDQLRESEQRFRLLVEGVKDYAIFMLDTTGHISTWNAGAERIKQYRASEIIGQHFSKFYIAEDLAAGKPAHELDVATRTGKYEEEGWRVRKDGTTFWANVLITALRNDAGELVGFAKVTRDLTERRASEHRALDVARRAAAEEAARLEAERREGELRELADALKRQTDELEMQTEELELQTQEAEDARRDADDARARAEEARERAQEANRAKSQFLAAMSHELRTPLNAIGGFTDLIVMGLSGPVTDQQLEQLGRIKRSQGHLLGIINDILNFSRIEAGQVSYDLGRVPLHDVAESVAQMLAPQAEARKVRLDQDCPRDVIAWADRAKVDQIVLNLVYNALKFTPAGGQISLSCAAEGERQAFIVRDTGCGISADQLEQIFEPFVQVGRSLTTNQEGAGLGLAISRDLARAMQGDITVVSSVDVGSEFKLILPRAVDFRRTAR